MLNSEVQSIIIISLDFEGLLFELQVTSNSINNDKDDVLAILAEVLVRI